MKSAKAPATDASSNRRAQPVRQTRTNPPRTSTNVGRGAGGRDTIGAGSLNDQPIEIFPGVTHFADCISALPKELVRHFTLLKEVDAKLSAPEAELFRLIGAAAKAPLPEHGSNDTSSNIVPDSAPMSAQNSVSGTVPGPASQVGPPAADAQPRNDLVYDPSNLPRRHLFRQTAIKIQEMLVSLEEKNHVISTANETLRAQLGRIDDVWPYLEKEFSDETKWGSTTHWAYPENRIGRSQADRARRDGAAAISAAAQALADEAAARSDARKQAVQAKKNSRNHNNHHQESDFDDHDGRHKNEGKKAHAPKSRKSTAAAATTTETNNVGLGITTASAPTNGNPPQKRRKVEKPTNGAPTERAMSTVFGNNVPKPKTTSPRATPAPEGPKKRKALPSGSGQSKKIKNGTTGLPASTTTSPVITELPEPKPTVRQSPAPSATPAPVPTRGRKNSVQSVGAEGGKGRPSSSASNKPNGTHPNAPEANSHTGAWPRSIPEAKEPPEPVAPLKIEVTKKEVEKPEAPAVLTPLVTKKENKPEDNDRKSESVPPTAPAPTVTTKSGRASKPSTPALATFQEASRSRSSRNAETNGTNKKTQKKGNSTIHAIVNQRTEEGTNNSMQGEDEDGDIDADEPTYCYCNSVSYGEMVACDAAGCPREWFHLECVGLRVAPGSKAKWYCEDCKERLKMTGKKANGR